MVGRPWWHNGMLSGCLNPIVSPLFPSIKAVQSLLRNRCYTLYPHYLFIIPRLPFSSELQRTSLLIIHRFSPSDPMGDPMTSMNLPISETQLYSIHTLWYNYGLQSDLRCPSVNGEHSAEFRSHWQVIEGVERNALQAQIRQFGMRVLPSTSIGC